MTVLAIHHVHFESPDLARAEAFAQDFGLITVTRDDKRLIMRTQGGDSFAYVVDAAPASRFVGFALDAEPGDLDAAVAGLGATPRRRLDTPGGGEGVTLVDPNGFEVSLVTGIARRTPEASVTALRLNGPADRIRHGESQHVRDLGPPTLFRLGHIGLFVRSFAETAAWYERTLAMIGSDVYHVPGQPAHKVVGFYRLNRGNDWVDHHTIALMQRDTPDCHHISFEAHDFEAQFVAHRWLKSQGHESIWGVGRHPHGSHVFDVWRSPDGTRFETFSDTDLLTAGRPTRVHDIRDVQMDIWSSDPPDRYFA